MTLRSQYSQWCRVTKSRFNTGRECDLDSSTLLVFLHIDVTVRHQAAGEEEAANHTASAAAVAVVCLAESYSFA